MNVKRTACILSAGALVTLAMPAFAERDGPRYQSFRDRDFNVQHRPTVRAPVPAERRQADQRGRPRRGRIHLCPIQRAQHADIERVGVERS